MKIKKQRGFMNFDFTGLFVTLGLICAIGGWCVIEGFLWICSHVDITWKW